jgi:hypothetical protein
MAVDFGWPWWAFTTIAVVVGAASLLLLRLVRSPLAHGILLTLLVEAVVIAALAPAVMTSAPRMHPAGSMKPATTPLTIQTGMGGSPKR